MNDNAFDVIISIMKSDGLRELAKDALFTSLDDEHRGFCDAYDAIDSDYMCDTINEVVKDTLRFATDMVENNIRKYINEDIDASLSRPVANMVEEMLCDEKYLIGYYDVKIMRNGKAVDSFTEYGSPDSIASTMDTYMNDNHPSDNWSEFSATISYNDTDILTMTNLRWNDYDIIADIDELLEIHRELAA